MNILIDNRSGTPLYDQIYTQAKQQIISGELTEDEALPSIRSLAKDLRISVITTMKAYEQLAYEELERDGFIYTVAGKGSFVAARNLELLREENLRKIEALMQEILRLAPACGLDINALSEMLRLLNEE